MSAVPTVLVTGAGRGIGRAAAEAFAAAGWRAVAGVRDLAAAREAYAGRPGIEPVLLDVRDPEAIERAVAQAHELAGGPLDCLVTNAAYAVLGAIEDVDIDEVRAMFETNLFGALAVVQGVLPGMREAGRGSLVFVSSIGARIANPLVGMYHASKYGLLAMAEALAVECRPFNVRVATIEPGMVDTDFPRAVRPTGSISRGEGAYAPLLLELRKGFAAWRAAHPTGPAEVAAAVLDAAVDPASPFRVEVGADTRELSELRRRLADDHAFHDALVAYLGLDWPRFRA